MADEPERMYKKLVEVPMFLLFFAVQMGGTVMTNLLMYLTCTITLGYNQTICTILVTKNESTDLSVLEVEVEPYTSTLNMVVMMGDAIIPALLALFLGAWSDKHGRKPIMILPLIGFILAYTAIIVLLFIPNISPWWFVPASIMASCSGGVCALNIAVHCYIGDITNETQRPTRMGIIHSTNVLGLFIGGLVSPYLLHIAGFKTVFGIGLATQILALLFVIFCIQESVQNREPFTFRTLFNRAIVVDIFATCSRIRDKATRIILWLTIFVLCIQIFVMYGGFQNDYLFVRNKFNWSLSNYVIFTSIQSTVEVLGTIMGVYVLYNYFKITEVFLAVISAVSLAVISLIRAFAFLNWHMYLTVPMKIFGGFIIPMGRAILCKLVTPNELGKVLSISIAIETLVPLFASPLYTVIYKDTILTFPGAYNLVSMSTYVIAVITLGIVYIVQKKYLNNQPVVLENEE